MSAYYEELVRQVAKSTRKDKFERLRIGKVYDQDVEPNESELDDAKAAIAEVLRTLKAATPVISAEFEHASRMGAIWTVESIINEFLDASPLQPPKEAQP